MADSPTPPREHQHPEECRVYHPIRMPPWAAGALVLLGIVIAVAALGIWWSLVPRPVRVPDVTLRPAEEARASLEAVGLAIGDVTQVPMASVVPGRVISQSPQAGLELERGATISLTVAKAPETVIMPDLAGLTGEQAAAALTSRGIIPTQFAVYSDTVLVGDVIAQLPFAGSRALQGEFGVVIVSGGRPSASTTLMPALLNASVSDATARLQELDLVPRVFTTSAVDAPLGSVVAQVPSAEEGVPIGSNVFLLVSGTPQ